ncbi:MAG: hypothetical protein ACHQ51_12350 [Elusimicrobiota bacterium]
MIDLFGMGRQEPQDPLDPATASPSDPADEPHAPRGSHRLWAFLLVLDSIFVIVFGGAVAAKVYQYWKTPAVAVAPAPHRHPAPVKPPEAAPKAPEAPPAVAAAPVKPAEPPKAEPKPAARRADAPRPPKPSLLGDGPKPHAAPSPAAVAAAPAPSAAAPAAPAPGKALPVVFKLRAPSAGSVQLVGAFIVRGGRKEMTKDGDGVWSVKLYLNPGQYRYFFSVDKKKTLDPENPRSDRGASLLPVP